MMKIKPYMHWGIFAYLAAITIGQATVNTASIVLFPILRSVLLALAVLTFAAYHITGETRRSFVTALMMISVFSAYGFLNITIDGPSSHSFAQFIQSFAIITLGVFFYSCCNQQEICIKVASHQVWFSVLIAAFLAVTGAIVFDFPPHIVYDIYVDGVQIVYNQGTSSFFGIGALCCLYLIKVSCIRAHQLLMLSLYTIFLLLSFLGGGRGEVLILLIVSALMTFNNGFRGILLGMILLFMAAVLIAFADVSFLSELLIYKRFLVIFSNSDYGLRDVLFSQAIALLFSDNRCFFIGCGFGAFQNYYGYPIELYPHNILLESFLTWGVLSTMLMVMLFIVGLLKGKGTGVLSYLGLYSVMIGMKSGDIVGSWLAFAYIFYNASIGFNLLMDIFLKRSIARSDLKAKTEDRYRV